MKKIREQSSKPDQETENFAEFLYVKVTEKCNSFHFCRFYTLNLKFLNENYKSQKKKKW